MGTKADLRRRGMGAVFIAIALGMLIVGQLLDATLQERLGKSGFVIFWLVCFLFTFLAILVAFWDLLMVRRRTREEQRALLEDTLGEIGRQKQARSQGTHGTGHSGNSKGR